MSDRAQNHAVERLKAEPHLFLPALTAWCRGWWYKLKFRLLLRDFKAGPMFRVYGPLVLSGPGKVRFGRNCLIISNAIKPVCIRTLSPKAEFSLGDSGGLNGTSIQCADRISIGENSNIADAYITDSAAHSIAADRRTETIRDAQRSEVVIGNNVWVSVNVTILHGVHIGNNSVIGACSLVRENVPNNVFMAGNPLELLREIDEQ